MDYSGPWEEKDCLNIEHQKEDGKQAEPATPNIPIEKPNITEPTTPEEPEEPSAMAPTVPEVPIPDPPKEVHTHSYTITATPPTCTQQGVTHYTCTCGYNYNGNYEEIFNDFCRCGALCIV